MRQTPIALLISMTLLSCSRINVSSQDHFRNQHMRHGIIPLSSNLAEKMNVASIERGKAIYKSHCLSCHGETGKGDGPAASAQKFPPANLHQLVREVKNFIFFLSISQWQGDMPGWEEKYNEAEREDLVAYIKTFNEK